MDAEQRNALRDRYEAGESIRTIADELGRSYNYVRRLLLLENVELRGRGGPNNPGGEHIPKPRVPKPVRPRPDISLALAVTNYRIAIELATYLLRRGKPHVALAVLERVQAPTRP